MSLQKKVASFFGFDPVEGEYGIEIEVEGQNLPVGQKPWAGKEDHSLRGEAREYIFRRPLPFKECPGALAKLELELTQPGVAVHDSRRTSVHVHRNMSEATVLQVYNLIALYYIFEIPMTEFAGPSRVGNMYCLRGIDAEYLPFQIVDSLQSGIYLEAFGGRDEVRYSGLNLCALRQFGSVEFRSFKGTIRTAEIMPWLEIIEALHTAALRFKDPQEISAEFFRLGPTQFLDLHMPLAFAKHVRTFTDYEDTMMVGHQYTFEIAHAIDDWHVEEEPVPVKKKKNNPFDFLQVQMPDWNAVPQRRQARFVRGLEPAPFPIVAPQPDPNILMEELMAAIAQDDDFDEENAA